jgi:serine/threonine-protein kinase SRPK3
VSVLTRGIDVKPDNVLFQDGTAAEDIQRFLDDSPPAIDGEFTLYGNHYPIIRSQPIHHSHKWDDSPRATELYSVCLMDLGHGTSFPLAA